ncbi:MAG: DUF3800 domain-containing protein [Desulfovibrionaceae bacterium]|nr:DUF3800 domain-containing protein [Desulfovibrionaceae bacterium]
MGALLDCDALSLGSQEQTSPDLADKSPISVGLLSFWGVMYLLYLDDSGSPKNANERHFVLGGFCIHEQGSYWVNKHLDELAEQIDPDHPQHVEFHASEIFRGKTDPWQKITKDRRREYIKDVLRVASRESKNISVFACAVYKPSFPNDDPVKLAFEDICQRFQYFLNRIYRESKQKERHQGLIVLDKSSHETSLQSLATHFRSKGTRWGHLNNIHEVPLFVDSEASRSIQLADHIAYSVFRRYEAGDINYFNIIQGCFDSADGKVHGLAHKQYAFPECTCPSCLTLKKGP